MVFAHLMIQKQKYNADKPSTLLVVENNPSPCFSRALKNISLKELLIETEK